jgi:anti-anti-sigma regulatory factor
MNIRTLIARCTLIREVNINFQTRTIGLFEIVEPVLEQDEVLDSNLLKQTIDSMISEGKRNISVDLARLDYLYSDTINALIVMNKRMLDVFGRLSLLAPQAPVMDILKKSGVQNILKVFADEAEIIRLSEELAGQVGGIPTAAATPKAPVSEFDDLRAEIGSAFGDGLTIPPAKAPSTQLPPPARPAHGPVAQPHFTPPHPQPALPPRPPMAPKAAPFEAAATKPPISPKAVPPKPVPAAQAQDQKRPAAPEMALPKQATQKSIPVSPKSQVSPDDFEAALDGRSATRGAASDRTGRKASVAKKSPAVPVVIALVLLVILGAGGYIAVNHFFSPGKEALPSPAGTVTEALKPEAPAAAPQTPAEKTPEQAAAPAAPEKPAEAVAAAPATSAAELQPAESNKKAAHAKLKAKKREAARKKAEIAASQPEESAPVKPQKPVTAAAPPKEMKSTTFIASQPPNADVYIDGQLVGKSYAELTVTPGTHTLRVVKDGKEVSQQITFREGKNPTTFISIK